MSIKTNLKLAAAMASTLFALSVAGTAQAYQQGYNNMQSGSGSGMGMGSGSGYSGGPGYYGAPGYGYQRPPMRPYGYQRPPMKPMPPMRPYGYQRPPMKPMRPYGYQRAPMRPMQPYGSAAPSMAAPAAPAASDAEQPQTAGAGVMANIQGMAFQPSTLNVAVGTTVTWVNSDGAPHTVTSTDGGPLASGTLNRGETYSMTFDKAGTYAYYCKFHPGMQATVIVE